MVNDRNRTHYMIQLCLIGSAYAELCAVPENKNSSNNKNRHSLQNASQGRKCCVRNMVWDICMQQPCLVKESYSS